MAQQAHVITQHNFHYRHVFIVAENNSEDAEAFSEMLSSAFDDQVCVVHVDRFGKLDTKLRQGGFHLLILNIDLPDRSGLKNICYIQKKYPELPIIVITAIDDLQLAAASLKVGAQECLPKSTVTSDVLARSVHYAKERKKIELKLKQQLKRAAYTNQQLLQEAKYDTLTGLANRAYFHDTAERILMSAQRRKKISALLNISLNNFEQINDGYGCQTGDGVLRQVAQRLKLIVRDSDFLARLDRAKFAVITDTIDSESDIYPLLARINDQFDSPFFVHSQQFSLTCSIGVSYYPDADNLEMLTRQNDCAMSEAKNHPHARVSFYSGKVAAQYERVRKIQQNLEHASSNQEITACFQPLLNVRHREDICVEVLARWCCKALGNVAPGEFIPIAENTSNINYITHMIAKRAHELYIAITNSGFDVGRIFINVSTMQVSNEKFCQLFLGWLQELGLPTTCVCLELEEKQTVKNLLCCKEQFTFLRDKGILLALDDYGTGYSSVNHLLELPFDIIKLDRSLMNSVDKSPRNQAWVAGIVETAHRLDIKVVAEGIENDAEKRQAIELGCDYLQGYHIQEPVSLQEAALYFKH